MYLSAFQIPAGPRTAASPQSTHRSEPMQPWSTAPCPGLMECRPVPEQVLLLRAGCSKWDSSQLKPGLSREAVNDANVFTAHQWHTLRALRQEMREL